MIIILLCLFLSVMTMPMYKEYSSALQPTAELDFFTWNHEFDRGISPECLHKFNVIPTANEKQLVIANQGTVYITPEAKNMPATKIKALFQHTNITNTPLVTLHQNSPTDDLLICSANNSYDTVTNKFISELIVFKNKMHTQNQFPAGNATRFPWPLQKITLINRKDLLGATPHFLVLFDLEKSEYRKEKKLLRDNDNENISKHNKHIYTNFKIIDFAVSPTGPMIVASPKGQINLLYYNKRNRHFTKYGLGTFINTATHLPETVRKVAFPTSNTILYIAKDYTARLADRHKLFTNSKTKGKPIIQSNKYRTAGFEQITLNKGNKISIAFWTKDYTASESMRSTIILLCINNNGIAEETILYVPFDKNTTYNDHTMDCFIEEKDHHLLAVTLHNNLVTASTTSGQFFVWNVPEPTTTLGVISESEKDFLLDTNSHRTTTIIENTTTTTETAQVNNEHQRLELQNALAHVATTQTPSTQKPAPVSRTIKGKYPYSGISSSQNSHNLGRSIRYQTEETKNTRHLSQETTYNTITHPLSPRSRILKQASSSNPDSPHTKNSPRYKLADLKKRGSDSFVRRSKSKDKGKEREDHEASDKK